MSLVMLLAASASAGSLTFTDVTTSAVNTTTPVNGDLDKEYALGDIDNDGDLDVVLAVADGIFGQRRNMVYINDNGVLNEQSTQLVANFVIDTLSRRPFLEDIDNDGWLDLIVVNDELAAGYAGHTHLWMNSHPGGVFQGFVQDDARLNGAGGDSCGAAMFDWDQDGDIDLYSGNYPGAPQDTMYLNNGSGVFTDVTVSNVPSDSDYTTDVITADFNGDGWMDISIGNHFNPSRIYYNHLRGQSTPGDFSTNGSSQTTVNSTTWHNATEAIDADGDGDLDLYMANWSGDQDALYVNNGNVNGVVQWTTIAMGGRVSQQESSKPLVVDFNDDGRMDLIVPAMDGRPVFLRNTSADGLWSFVDWTPANIPNGTARTAFSASMFDANLDGHLDLAIWGHHADYLYSGAPAPTYDADTLGGTLPDLSQGPVVIQGATRAGGRDYFLSSAALGTGEFSVVARSCGDIKIRAGSSNGGLVWSDRADEAGEEVVSYASTSGIVGVGVVVNTVCGDADGDGDLDNFDFSIARACVQTPDPSCVAAFDADMDGQLTWDDALILQANSNGPGVPADNSWTLEINKR